MVSQITTGDHPKCADGGQRSRLRAAQGVLTITIVDDLPFGSSRQIEIAREDIAPAVIAVERPIVVSVWWIPLWFFVVRARAATNVRTRALVISIAVVVVGAGIEIQGFSAPVIGPVATLSV